jgi:hypothetical protein
LGKNSTPAASNCPLNGEQVRFARETAARFEIAQHAQPDLSCGGKLDLRPIKEATRRAAGRSTQDHHSKLVRVIRSSRFYHFPLFSSRARSFF